MFPKSDVLQYPPGIWQKTDGVTNPKFLAQSEYPQTSQWHPSTPMTTKVITDTTNQQLSLCKRCGTQVYPAERIQPHRDAIFHKSCFRCCSCNSSLTLQSFYSNPCEVSDVDVYCKAHVPRLKAATVDSTALAIIASKGHTKGSAIICGHEIQGSQAGKSASYDATAMCIQAALRAPKVYSRPKDEFQTPRVATDVVKCDVIGLKYL